MATASPPKEPPVVNVPNILTASRLGMAIVLFVLIEFNQWLACLGVFIVAAFTDWLDGYLARKWQMGSTLGRNMDPLVDKVLVCGAYIFLVAKSPQSGLYAWMATVVVSREMIITGLRGFMENKGATFGADWLGKIKMVLQCGALIAIFWVLHAPEDWAIVVRDIFIWGMLLSTSLSGLQYLWKAFSLLKTE